MILIESVKSIFVSTKTQPAPVQYLDIESWEMTSNCIYIKCKGKEVVGYLLEDIYGFDILISFYHDVSKGGDA